MQQRDEVVSDAISVDLLGYLRSLLRYWVIGVVMAVLVGTLGGWYVTRTDTLPSDQRSMHLLFDPGAQSTTDGAGTNESLVLLVRTYSNLADSPVVLEATQKNLGDTKYTVEQLAAMTTLYYGGGSYLVRVDAKAATTAEADRIAQAYSQAWIDNLTRVAPPPAPYKPTLTIVQQPFNTSSDPAATAAKSPAKKLIMVGAAALAMGVASMAAVEAFAAALRRRKLADQILADHQLVSRQQD